jgi:hypothetical protein
MTNISVGEFIPTLQIAIGPVILISGVALLLLTMTNRLGRVVDRSRFLWRELRGVGVANREAVQAQLKILLKRARLIRLAIMLASVSLLLASVLIIMLFLIVLLRFEGAWLIITLFIGCLLTLIGSLLAFIKDVNQSLVAFKLDIGER